MRWPSLALPLVLLVLGAGCLQGLGPGSVGAPAQHGQAAGNPSGHGTPQVQTSDVTVVHEGARYKATQTVTVGNGFGGADQGSLSLATLNGDIRLSGTDSGSYQGTARLVGSGTTEQMARDALASLAVATPDQVSGTLLSFGLEVKTTGDIDPQAGRGADITFSTPKGPAYDLRLATSNGDASVASLRGDEFSVATRNGDVTLTDVAADRFGLATTNADITLSSFTAGTLDATSQDGDIKVHGVADDARLATSNGGIEGTLQPAHTGSYTLTTSNGDIQLKLAGGSGNGFDATATTSNGRASISLHEGQEVGDQTATHAHQATQGFQGRSIRTVVQATTSNSDAAVTQS